ncbi:restriction endonuclease subunit S [Giesbergeria anulus]|uniref:Type I restriction enzyme, S subunit n=1 Tax=Giesbergeria anulus TaxID=180197 RepID=A0A1H9I768_9BURK|nr:restriction endonuclease subunit S [Giesbergeria anulus]SEQ70430.1 type I restriction enzyme, S subunit [Giesbergeria anulus]
MENYPAYRKYKQTRCAWLKEIPEHWDFKRLKNVATHNDETLDERADPDLEIKYVDISSVSLVNGIEKIEAMPFEKSPSRARRKVKDGDIIVSTVRTYLKAIAPVCEPPENMVVSTGFAVVRPKENLFSGFAGYLLQSNGFVGDVVANSVGVSYPAINASDLARIPVIEPPLEEQKAIARFLDFKTAQIDALIAKKKALLDKLAEKRTALISHAVTKGLDSSVPMKDSKAAWLGHIPRHWEAKRLKFVISEPLKYGANEAAELTDPELPRYIRITDVNDDGSLREDTFRSLPQEIADDYLLSDGDILLARSGATVGKSFIYKPSWGMAAYAGYLIRARMSDAMNPDFAYLFLQSSCYWQWLSSVFIQATIQNVSAEKYANLVIPVPPINEQLSIVSRLLVQLKSIDVQRERVGLVIDRLIEYRSALITNAVTGKIDVRGFQVPSASAAKAQIQEEFA